MNTPTKKTFVLTYVALIALLVATVVISFFDLGIFNIVAALLIALTKMLLIILFFMHVRYSSRLIWVAACVGFFWLGILLVLAMGDYLTRGW
jgi:cytochrome c oxidase subunit 4